MLHIEIDQNFNENQKHLMKWLILPCLAFLLFGAGSIFLKRGLVHQPSEMLFPIYTLTLFLTSFLISISRVHAGWERPSSPLVLYALAMGAAVGCALFCQLKAMEMYPAKGTMVILISSLFPIITIAYDLVAGHPPTPKQWMGITLCLIGLVFIGYPEEKRSAAEITLVAK